MLMGMKWDYFIQYSTHFAILQIHIVYIFHNIGLWVAVFLYSKIFRHKHMFDMIK